MSDDELLRAYAVQGSEAAFGEIVRRHAGAVQAAALRQTANPHLAEEVTHAVFFQLARKAARIRPPVVLLGWLLRAARYAAIDATRAEERRRKREAEFLAMQPTALPETDSESLWAHVAPRLDAALHRLRARDRDALLLRYFQNKPLAAVGAALGVPEDAARKRVQRALDRLQQQLQRDGAFASGAMLPTLLLTRAAPATPSELASTAVRAALQPLESSVGKAGSLAQALGWRLWWAAVKPWMIGAVALALAGGTAATLLPRGSMASVGAETVEDDYRPAGFPDARVVRNFVGELQRRLATGERQQVAGMMRFPVRINSSRGTEYLGSESELLARYEEVFGPKIVGILLKSPNRGLFCDSNGVMVGDGTLWIAPVGDPARPTARVIALNLP